MEGQITQVVGAILLLVGVLVCVSDVGGGLVAYMAIFTGLLFIPLGGIWSTLEKILKK